MKTPLERIENQRFGEHDTVTFDGKLFVRCVFAGCEIVYGGGDVAYEGCVFSDCRLTFVDAAHRTVEVMRGFGYTIVSPSGENPKTKYFH